MMDRPVAGPLHRTKRRQNTFMCAPRGIRTHNGSGSAVDGTATVIDVHTVLFIIISYFLSFLSEVSWSGSVHSVVGDQSTDCTISTHPDMTARAI
jgi:hypothetical protein